MSARRDDDRSDWTEDQWRRSILKEGYLAGIETDSQILARVLKKLPDSDAHWLECLAAEHGLHPEAKTP